VGGLAGEASSLENTQASGDVSGAHTVGNLIGYAYGHIHDSVSSGTTTEDGEETGIASNGNSNEVTEDGEAIQGLIDEVGPTSTPDPVSEIAVGAALLNTENDPLVWGQSQSVNGGSPYLLALRQFGYYDETTQEDQTPQGTPTKITYLSTIAKLYLYLKGNSSIEITVGDFNFLYVTGVSEENLPTLLKLLKEIDLSTLGTEVIQENVKKADGLLEASKLTKTL
jgi:hypothetical protein